jgi:hypothetical protein
VFRDVRDLSLAQSGLHIEATVLPRFPKKGQAAPAKEQSSD